MDNVESRALEAAILTSNDFLQAAREEELEWNRTHRIGSVSFDPVNREIKVHRSYPPIGLDELQTARDAFHWLCHLSCKSWFTPQLMHDFVMMLRKVARINEYCKGETA